VKILSVVGARPQFIKCAPVSREIRKNHTEILVHTGQHYDPEMSEVFFQELEIPKPDYNLGIGSGSHGEQTGMMLIETEKVVVKEKPDLLLVYGDTNSTLAGALAAAKLHIPVAHVESGLRSFDKMMPEEINRILTDQISDFLFCPTQTAVNNLAREGITKGVNMTGDVMVDAMYYNQDLAKKRSRVLEDLRITHGRYLILTVHRPSNTDYVNPMRAIFNAIGKSGIPVVFPVHPRTRKRLREFGIWDNLPENLIPLDPLGYLDMLQLMQHAQKILTDSGGVQKEAYILGIPCITLRENTEWVETLAGGWNVLVGANYLKIYHEILKETPPDKHVENVFGNGDASMKISDILSRSGIITPR
jgi:UDP-GlcNAc3NAcA epimerase